MPKKFLLTLFFTLVYFSGIAQKLRVEEKTLFLTQLANKAQGVTTLKADFRQEKYLDILADKIISEGQIILKAPSKLKWAYKTPFEYTVILTGQEILINDEGQKTEFKIESNKIFKQVSEMVINSVKGNLIDEEQFDARYFKEGANYRVELAPLEEAMSMYFDRIILFINPSFLVTNIQLIEPSGDYTTIQFDKHIINADIKEDEFTL